MEMRNKVHKLFGDRASRMTTVEMTVLAGELAYGLAHDVPSLRATRSLPCKLDHGDADFVYRMEPTLNLKDVLSSVFGKRVLEYSKNGDVTSILYDSGHLNKAVHVDFIKATDQTFRTKLQYFSFNDFSGIFGMLSKKYHFKYGSEGFFKRYRDTRGNWHDLLVSYDLTVGLELLGYDPAHWEKMQDYEDMIKFMLSSSMFDYQLFVHETLNQSDKKSMKRPVVEYVVDALRKSEKTATITDEDHFFSQTTSYSRCKDEVVAIEKRIEERRLERERRLDVSL